MASDTETIEREIERARDQLATTLDELATRANPKRLVENVRHTVTEALADPKIRAALAGVGALVVAIVVVRARR